MGPTDGLLEERGTAALRGAFGGACVTFNHKSLSASLTDMVIRYSGSLIKQVQLVFGPNAHLSLMTCFDLLREDFSFRLLCS